MANRGISQRLFRLGLRTPRLILDGSHGAVETPFHLTPQAAAPTGTASKGDAYFDSTVNSLVQYNGTVWSPVGGNLGVKTAAATLSAADNGATCFFNSAAGDIYTLPTAQVGLEFTFVILVTITSNAAKVITASASEFLLGSYIQSTDGTYTSAAHAANGSTIRAISMNGTTTGGLVGDWWKVKAISTTQWGIWGMGRATGTEATPFATS